MVKNWSPLRCWHVSKWPDEASAFFNPPSRVHHTRSPGVLPHSGTTSFSEDVALRRPLQSWRDTYEVTSRPRSLESSRRLQQQPPRYPPAVRPLYLSHIEDLRQPYIQSEQLWMLMSFHACNSNSPAPIITAVTTNSHMKIMQLQRYLQLPAAVHIDLLLQQEGRNQKKRSDPCPGLLQFLNYPFSLRDISYLIPVPVNWDCSGFSFLSVIFSALGFHVKI